MAKNDAIVIDYAIVNKVLTTADNGVRVYFDLPEDAIPEAALLMDYKRTGQPLRLEIREE